jgi:hypothetical protein
MAQKLSETSSHCSYIVKLSDGVSGKYTLCSLFHLTALSVAKNTHLRR